MKTEIAFAACCGVICAVALWCAARLGDEPFYMAVAVFTAGFWGSMAAFVVWSRISERETRKNEFRPSIIWPRR